MNSMLLALHISVCLALIILVLLQSGKEGMGVIFGGGNSSIFGAPGAGGLLAKLTAFMAIIFVATCLSYNIISGSNLHKKSTILDVKMEDSAPATQQKSAPAPLTPATTPETKTPSSDGGMAK